MICTYVQPFKAQDGSDLVSIHMIDNEDNNKVCTRCVPVNKVDNFGNLVPGSILTLAIGLTGSGKAYVKRIIVSDELVTEITL